MCNKDLGNPLVLNPGRERQRCRRSDPVRNAHRCEACGRSYASAGWLRRHYGQYPAHDPEEIMRLEAARSAKARLEKEAAREWEVRLVRWERELGLVSGPVLMCECSGQFGRRCPACRKFWNTPRSPSRSRSRSRSPARYFHRVFKDGAMRVEECPLRCKSARVYMHSFLESTPQTPPRLDSPPSSPDAAPPRPVAPPPARPMAPPPPPPPAPLPRPVAPPLRQVEALSPDLTFRRLESLRTYRRVRRSRPVRFQPPRPDPETPDPPQTDPQSDVVVPLPRPRRSCRVRHEPYRYQSVDFRR